MYRQAGGGLQRIAGYPGCGPFLRPSPNVVPAVSSSEALWHPLPILAVMRAGIRITLSLNRRKSKVLRTGTSATVVLPKDWCRGENVEIGDEVEVLYDGELRIRPVRARSTSVEGSEED